jgi:hypothetical protein
MAPKRAKVKSGSSYSRVETNLYREVRSGALRFKVLVHPLKPQYCSCKKDRLWLMPLMQRLAAMAGVEVAHLAQSAPVGKRWPAHPR